jgi:Rrf2 family protein
MSSILKFSDASSLALHTMWMLAQNLDQRLTAKQVAEKFYVSEAHLSKVLQRLAKQGLVKSMRGPGGGFVLARAPKKISLLEVFEAIEGPLVDSNCLIHLAKCPRHSCIVGELTGSLNKNIRNYLSKTSLEDILE